MASKIKNMTQGKPAQLIVLFALPLMAGNVFQQLYTIVDTMVVGKYLGVNALAALGAAEWLSWLMLGIIQGFTQGFSIQIAQEFGADRLAYMRKIIGCSAILAAILAVVLVIAGQVVVRPILLILHTPEEIIGDTLTYIRLTFMGVPIVMLYNMLSCILRSLGDSKTPLYAMIVASLTNIVLDIVFVMGFHWGIAGAAIATLIGQLISSIYCLYFIVRIPVLKMDKRDFHLDLKLSGKLMYLGLPMAFQNAVIAVGGMIVQSVVNGVGVIFIAGFTATNKLYGLLEIAATSYGYAMVTYVGQNLGAGRIDRIRLGIRQALLISLATSAVIAAAMLLLGKTILGCFISGTPEEFEAALQVAYHYLAIMSICLPILYILHVVRSVIQGMGNTVLPMLSGITEFIMRTGAALLLPKLVGENGIFYAEILAWLGADVVLVTSYFIVINKETKNNRNIKNIEKRPVMK